MVKVKLTGNFEGQELYIDGFLKSNLDYLNKDVRNDNDCIIVVSGREGSGKSWLTIQAGAYLDPTLTLDRIVFNPAEFKKAVMSAKKYQVVIFDEAITGLRAARWANEVNQALIEMLGQIRQLNLFIFIVIPSFFELGRYIAIHRSQALLMTYKDRDGKRGRFSAFDYAKKKYMYVVGKKTFNERVTSPVFFGRFYNQFPLDEAAYREKKRQALNAPQAKTVDGVRALKWKMRLQALVNHLHGLEKDPWTDDKVQGVISEGDPRVKITRIEVNHLRNQRLKGVSV